MSISQTKGREHSRRDARMEIPRIPGTELKVSRVAIGTWAIRVGLELGGTHEEGVHCHDTSRSGPWH